MNGRIHRVEEDKFMSDCTNCKAVIFIDGSRYCEYDGSICHDEYDDSGCEYFELAKFEI